MIYHQSNISLPPPSIHTTVKSSMDITKATVIKKASTNTQINSFTNLLQPLIKMKYIL